MPEARREVPPSSFPPALATPYAGELDFGASSGGIATPNVAPDIIAKLAIDPNKQVHFEIGGVERNFKVYYPGVAAVAATGLPLPFLRPTDFLDRGRGRFRESARGTYSRDSAC